MKSVLGKTLDYEKSSEKIQHSISLIKFSQYKLIVSIDYFL